MKINWHKVEKALPEGEFVMQIGIDGKKLCLVRHEERLYAVQNSCPHAGGILSGGWCKNGHLVCPIHRWEYSLETGRGATGQGDYIDKYPVESRPDGVYIGIKQGFWKRIFS
jgi:nitrite reductase/ring-hydroxylating ferredoxin subunit